MGLFFETSNRYCSKVIDAIADYIDEHGWVQDVYVSDDGCVCLDGGLRAVTLGDPDRKFGKTLEQTVFYGEIVHHLTREINGYARMSTPWYSIHQWNDLPEMTEGRVIYLLRTAARKLRGGV